MSSLDNTETTVPKVCIRAGALFDGVNMFTENVPSVLTENGRITAILPYGAPPPDDYDCVDAANCTLLPGLIDAHVHLSVGPNDASVPGVSLAPGLSEQIAYRAFWSYQYAFATVEAGFTTVRDAGGLDHTIVALRDAIRRKAIKGPRIVACGQYIGATGGHADYFPSWLSRSDTPSNAFDGVDGVRLGVRQQVKARADWIKFFATGGISDAEYDKQEFSQEEMNALVLTARQYSKPVAAHCMHEQGTLCAVKAGVASVEHGSRLNAEIVKRMTDENVWLVPTLSVAHAAVYNASGRMSDSYITLARTAFERHTQSFALALEAGVPIALGTDCGFNMLAHGQNGGEFALLCRYGMTPLQALRCGTSEAARMLGMSEIGSIRKGCFADLVLIAGNPLTVVDLLSDARNIWMVMIAGEIVKADRRICVTRASEGAL